MTMIKIHGSFNFQCDGCNDPIDTGLDEFEAAREALRNDGWTTVRDAGKGSYRHFCEDCWSERYPSVESE